MDEGSYPRFVRQSLRRRWTVIVLALVLGLGVGTFLITTSTSDYQATSVVFLEPTVGNPYSPTTPTGRQEQLAALTTEAGLLLADSVSESAEAAAGEAGVDLGPQIQERTSTEVPSNSQVINVSFTAASPEVAQFGAQALATAYLDYRQDRSEEVTSAQLARIDEEISSLTSLMDVAAQALSDAGPALTAEGTAELQNLEEQVRIYANQLAQARIERVSVEGAVVSPGEIVSPARLPTQPEGLPAPLLAAAVVLALLVSGVVIAMILEHLDTRLRSRDEVERLGLRPVYGPAPLWHPELTGSPDEDAYRLAAGPTGGGVRVLLGADGPVPLGVAAGMGHALAENGQSVLIVLCAAPAGQAEGAAGLSDALQQGDNAPADHRIQATQGIQVMGVGRHPEAVSSLVHGPRFRVLLDTLALECDTLLVVGAEAESATGAALARRGESTLLVCIAGQTREENLGSSVRMVQDEGVLGGVFLAAKPTRHLRSRSPVSDLDRLTKLLTNDRVLGDLRPNSTPEGPPRHRTIRETDS